MLLPLAIIAAFAGLIPAGQWQGDEYYNFAMLRDLGWRFFSSRVLTWSPRPFSESLLYLYADCVALARQRLLAPFLALLWGSLVASACGAMRGPDKHALRLFIALGIVALFLVGHPVGELFYWPMSAAAYLASLASITVVVLQSARGAIATPRARVLCAAALTIAATSAEMGAMFAGSLSLLLLAIAWRRRRNFRWALATYLPPLIASLIVFALLLQGRVAKALDPGFNAGSLRHHLLASLAAAAHAIADPTPKAVLVWTLLALGLGFSFSQIAARVDRARMVAIAAALIATAYLSIAAADYQFGDQCCERHASLRACLMVLLAVAVAATLSPRRPIGPAGLGPLMLVGLIAAAAIPEWRLIRADYQLAPTITRNAAEIWRAGNDPTLPKLVFRLPPAGAIVEGGSWPNGHYAMATQPPWFAQGIMSFFKKRYVDILN